MMPAIPPITRSKAQARRNYDRLSSVYDVLTAGEKHLTEQGTALLNLQPGERVLEIGCGTGTGLQMLASPSDDDRLLVGLDLSHKMLLRSQAKIPAVGLVQGDGTHLPLHSQSFAVVFSAFTLELFSAEDIHCVLGECWRVLIPGGRLGLIALAQTPRTLALKLYELAHQLFPVAIDCRAIPLLSLLEENGFTILTATQSSTWGLPVAITLATKPA